VSAIRWRGTCELGEYRACAYYEAQIILSSIYDLEPISLKLNTGAHHIMFLIFMMYSRILKIESMVDYIITNVEVMDRLSFNERTFAAKLNDLNNSHFEDTVYSKVPEDFRDLILSNDSDRVNHARPRLNEFVFCKAPQDVENIEVADGSYTDMSAGVVHVMPYHAVQPFVLADEVQLI
jgi:DNA replication complex GINS protein SLD5 C-terminus